jgi:hypothetical protein
MRKVLLLLVGATVLCAPAVSVAGDSTSGQSKSAVERETSRARESNPASVCKRERGATGFAASHNGRTFSRFYGTNGGNERGAGANAFGKCVSANARRQGSEKDSAKATHLDDPGERHGKDRDESRGDDSAERPGNDHVNPAMTCKAMRARDLAHFQRTYGMRPNAFGKCVSGHASGKHD